MTNGKGVRQQLRASCQANTHLEFTPLITLSVRTWIGNAAAVLCGQHGDITHQTQQAGCSRQAAYEHANRVQQAVADAQRPGPTYDQLLEHNQQLRLENQQLWDALEHAVDFPQAKQQQFAASAAAMGLSLSQTLALLVIVLPAARCPSRAHLGRWVQQAAQQAGRLAKVLDQACQQLVLCLCLDEIFFRRQPVLMAVEPHSMAWLLAERAADRSGPTWAKALAAWPAVTDVAADGGSGIKRGLELAAAKRQEDAEAKATADAEARAKAETTTAAERKAESPASTADQATVAVVPLHVGLDVFHIRQEGERALHGEWRHAEAVWAEVDRLERAKARFDRTGKDRRHFNQDVAAKAWDQAVAAFDEAQRYETAWSRAVAALAVCRPDGRLNDRAWATAELQAAAAELTGPRWAKTRRMLLDPRALTFLDRLNEALAVVEPCPERREGLLALWRWRRDLPTGKDAAGRAPLTAELEGLVVGRLGAGWQESLGRVNAVLRRVVRASSAVECVNSVVRMHQARHRQLTQELLDLKRVYWNCRSFVSGQRRGRCPYEHLGLKLPTYDPWALLQMDPQLLKQQLSTPRLTE